MARDLVLHVLYRWVLIRGSRRKGEDVESLTADGQHDDEWWSILLTIGHRTVRCRVPSGTAHRWDGGGGGGICLHHHHQHHHRRRRRCGCSCHRCRRRCRLQVSQRQTRQAETYTRHICLRSNGNLPGGRWAKQQERRQQEETWSAASKQQGVLMWKAPPSIGLGRARARQRRVGTVVQPLIVIHLGIRRAFSLGLGPSSCSCIIVTLAPGTE